MPPQTITKFDFIDTLRGLAIIGVVLCHSAQLTPPTSNLLELIARNGQYGVQLFFIVSALTLALSIKTRSPNENFPLRNFFIRRFFRIAPMFYFAIALYLYLKGLSPRYWAPDGVKWWYVPLAMFFLNGWLPAAINSLVTGGWTIAVEMTFYLTLPYLYTRIKNIPSAIYFIILTIIGAKILNTLALAVLPHYNPTAPDYLINNFTYFWFFSQIPVFGVGLLIFHIFNNNHDLSNKKPWGYFLLFLSLFVGVVFLKTATVKNILPAHILCSFAFGILTASLYIHPNKLIVNPLTQWIGKLSFSIYLIHLFIISIINKYFALPVKGNVEFIIVFLTLLSLATFISYLTYHLVELPGIRLGQRLIEKLERKS